MPAQGKDSIDDVGRSGGCHSQEGLCGKGERVSVITGVSQREVTPVALEVFASQVVESFDGS